MASRRLTSLYRVPAALFLALLFVGGPLNADEDEEYGEIGREAARMLADIIRLDTTNPPGNENIVADYLADVFEREGIRYQRLARDTGRDNVIARYHGSGHADPILLYSHSDVVPATSEWGIWSVPPFSGVVQDGSLYGRGAIDAKGLLVCHLAAMLLLKRNNIALDRDVIFLAAAAEETGGGPGVAWLLNEHRDAIEAGVALGEGGRVWVRSDTVWSVMIQAAEKSAHNLKVTALGQAGHASVPSSENAIVILNDALQVINNYQFPLVFNPVTSEFFERITPYDTRVEDGFSRYDALTHNTATVTLIEGGVKTNIIPAFAQANLNSRILPGEDLDSVVAVLEAAVNDPRVTIRHKPGVVNGATINSFDTPLYYCIEQTALGRWPSAVITPYQSPATSDASKLRRAGILTYGLLPFPLTEEESSTVHGPDERVNLENLTEGVIFMYEILLNWAASDVSR